jgi:hypothetical protein
MPAPAPQIGRLYFGMIDAKAELTSEPLDKPSYSRESFFMPPGLEITDLLSDRLFFITGFKGTGKTALLRYMASEFKSKLAFTEIFLFRDALASGTKYLADPENTSFIDKNSDKDFIDFELPMLWFIHRQIYQTILKKAPTTYLQSSEFADYGTVIKLFLADPEAKSGLASLFPRLKDGNIELSINVLSQIKGAARLNFEWLKDDTNKVPIEIVVDLANERLSRLTKLPNAVRIFFDEIEVSLSSAKQFRRDAQIIRDFIIAIGKINHRCATSNVNIRLIAAVRREVVRSAFATGKEIYKLLEDYGTEIKWFEPVAHDKQPLLHVVESKIAASEAALGVTNNANAWDTYFTSFVQRTPIREWIIGMTWCRPRDIVRLLTTAKNGSKKARKFVQAVAHHRPAPLEGTQPPAPPAAYLQALQGPRLRRESRGGLSGISCGGWA